MTTDIGQKIADGQDKKDWTSMSVSDGGLYDNLGLQPVKDTGTVLASDGGASFHPSAPKSIIGLMGAYLAIMGKQAGAIRKQDLITEFNAHQKKGTYWGIGSAVERYPGGKGDTARISPPTKLLQFAPTWTPFRMQKLPS